MLITFIHSLYIRFCGREYYDIQTGFCPSDDCPSNNEDKEKNMRTFEHFNQSSDCPICGTNEDKKATLLPIDGTEKGNICEAAQVHVDCLQNLEFHYLKMENGQTIVYAVVQEKD